MAFARPKKREPVGEAGLFEYAVGTLARKMRTVRDLNRLMRAGYGSNAIFKLLRSWRVEVPVEVSDEGGEYELPEF